MFCLWVGLFVRKINSGLFVCLLTEPWSRLVGLKINSVNATEQHCRLQTTTTKQPFERRLHLSKQTALDTPIHKLGSRADEMFHCSEEDYCGVL